MTASTVLKWHGGKAYLADWINGLMPDHVHYVEPYFGGGSVLLDKDPVGISEVANDIHGQLTNFWRVLQHPDTFPQFHRTIQAVPFSQVEWRDAALITGDPVTDAVNFFIRCRQSRAGKFDCFATLSRNRTRSKMNEQVSAWQSAVAELPAVSERLRRVVILNDHAPKVIKQQYRRKTLFYCDPPYYHASCVTTRDYAFEMTHDDHVELLDTLCRCSGKVMLSGYRNDLYDHRLSDWNREERVIDNKASSAKNKPKMIECLWMNF